MKEDKSYERHKLDMKKLEPWNEEGVNIHFNSKKIQKVDEFSIEDYHLENRN